MAKQSITQSAFLYLDTQPLLFHYALAMVTVTAALLATLYTPVIGERTAFMLFFLRLSSPRSGSEGILESVRSFYL
ncbi:MAG: hypothetical protein U1D41_01635 [Nitrosomonas sp.]|uniref:hypothetical protein n=1 Tax=Nitrosomonas sp. TaxID=42353 RepID=UPI0027323EAE|nr:hypothetical protein [Nitrosomonas sp.]MDP3663331.1 hypothetical protein [Nitrosomonas sp.]MDZ4104863.1 hypothetical protein [Nitrosomonas sp.]